MDHDAFASYLPIPLVGPRPVLGEPLVPLSIDPTPGDVGFEEPLAPTEPFDPGVPVVPDAPLVEGDGQSPADLLDDAELGRVPPALGLPPLPSKPGIVACGQAVAAPDADVPGVRVPPVEPGAADVELPMSDLGSTPLDGAPGAAYDLSGLLPLTPPELAPDDPAADD